MRLREMHIISMACVYGNDRLDAEKGFKRLTRECLELGDLIFYFDKDRKKESRATLDYTNPNTQVMLLRELRKNISTKVAVGEREHVFGKTGKDDIHILGGRNIKVTEDTR